MSLRKVVSGGQTGVDRAALDAALDAGILIGGWCPRGRRAEDGRVPDHYPLRETPSPVYAERTAWNVRASDGTLILATGSPTGGTALTIAEADRAGRPVYVAALDGETDPDTVRAWLAVHAIRVLNVAGPRASEAPGVYDAAYAFVMALLADG